MIFTALMGERCKVRGTGTIVSPYDYALTAPKQPPYPKER
jgi:hypothetical protein